MQKGVYFVSGIDTDAGKSYVTGHIALEIMKKGGSVITQKFIQTGGTEPNGISLDINIHRQIMQTELFPEDIDGTTAPVIFSYPASPHLAAIIDKKEIDFAAIERSTRLLSSRYDTLLIEGAGGIYVPLKGDYTTADYVEEKRYPLILATSGKLGSINHTILTLEACRAREIEVAVVAYNRYFGNDTIIDNDSFEYICDYVKKYHPHCEIMDVCNYDVRLI